MNENGVQAILPIAALFGVFLVFVAALYVRSRRNALHPPEQRSPAAQLRSRIIWSAAYLALLGGTLYLMLQRTSFAPSWTTTYWLMFAAFVLGRMSGTWGLKDAHPSPDPSSPAQDSA